MESQDLESALYHYTLHYTTCLRSAFLVNSYFIAHYPNSSVCTLLFEGHSFPSLTHYDHLICTIEKLSTNIGFICHVSNVICAFSQ